MAADVVINEIHYDHPDKTAPAEFIELYNAGRETVDLSDWQVSDGVSYTIPQGTSLGADQYLVIAEDPETARQVFAVESVGPWQGRLANEGESVTLFDPNGEVVDRVDYQLGFPWPTVGDRPGSSIELINPSFQNDVGGNWRRAATADQGAQVPLSRGETWKYFRGNFEPSQPTSLWRNLKFDDSAWESGAAPIGYGESLVATNLTDMRGNYSSVYLRRTFEVSNVSALPALELRALYDDGFNLWINGQHVAGENVSGANLPFSAAANSAIEQLDFVAFDLPAPAEYLVEGTNVIAVQLLNASRSNSSDAFFDAELVAAAGFNATPGSRNSAFADNAPPQARKVSHGELPITSGADALVTAKVTDPDGVARVELEYQVVEPGDYFGRYSKARTDGSPVLNPRYDDPREWTTIAMRDDGSGPDEAAGDAVFAATISGDVNQHRRLIRYRITVEDTLSASVRVPYADDPQHNFAYFVYDSVPDWTASIRPGVEPAVTYDFDQLQPAATYHLLTSSSDHEDALHIPDAATSSYGGSEYLWPGTLVYDGQVYDNIRYRARGGTWRYAMGKNMWKFDFNRGHSFQARDDLGRPYETTWDKLNFSAIIQQGNYLHRGEQGLFESVGFKLFNLAGVESPYTHYVHFRVVDSEDELGADQFSGDFQGLYLAIEQPDGRMLDEHGLPDGNLYKIESHRGSSNNQGPTQVTDGSDVAAFISGYRGDSPTAQWWNDNLDLDKYYSYRTIVEAIHHYDIAYGKNYFYYHNPETGKFEVHPWDIDLIWADNMYGSGDHDFKLHVADDPAFRVDYQNRVRELMDLLYNPEQTGMLIDEVAAFVYTPGQPSLADVDRAMWDYNPILRSSHTNPSKAGYGRFYESSPTDDFAGMIKLMKDYVVSRSAWMERRLLTTERRIPDTPTISYTGETGFPINGVAFQASAFSDPQGDSTFAAMEWRIAEVTDPSDPSSDTIQPRQYEIGAIWETGELDATGREIVPPFQVLEPGHLYRARVRMRDRDGHWSHWSSPMQFAAGAPMPSDLSSSLRISEVHYHPFTATPEEAEAGFTDADEFEFIELVNIGSETIDLTSAQLTRTTVDGEETGVEFDFATGAITTLEPGEHVLVVENWEAFLFRYGDGYPVTGQWAGKLNNANEQVTLMAEGDVIMQFVYEDAWHPTTDGGGYSLEANDPREPDTEQWKVADGWRPSVSVGGSPGTSRVRGDFNTDLIVSATDIDLLFAKVRSTSNSPIHDLTSDRIIDQADAKELVENVLDTFMGDADLDGEVGFSDLVALAETFGSSAASWSAGDFDGNGEIGFGDLVLLADNFGKRRTL